MRWPCAVPQPLNLQYIIAILLLLLLLIRMWMDIIMPLSIDPSSSLTMIASRTIAMRCSPAGGSWEVLQKIAYWCFVLLFSLGALSSLTYCLVWMWIDSRLIPLSTLLHCACRKRRLSSLGQQEGIHICLSPSPLPQWWGTAGAEIKWPPVGNPGLSKVPSSLSAWSRSIVLPNMLCLLVAKASSVLIEFCLSGSFYFILRFEYNMHFVGWKIFVLMRIT